ncbi:Pkinase domain-containing protein/LRR_1 domain-containing protein/LRRNT_2 domain-containing protein/LRR_6 domain-containing protein [Cephalotus follicularis]|uniref:non-specific serine/threonine protein kinase n=1 Tax=Cephalotus follicularis TaxID=3775 RepID=A0A1Q3C5U1_CEPFO|nr:Pkinase domain-containing protein/LRR_1 domain-containing protein/LRRNT_2 domain-containing protein/LRR_6 domain-containing protein [Cephalotus follicularis]
MRSWNDSVDFCNWFGVTCNPSNDRVAILNLENQGLIGSIPPSIGNLTFLTGLNLQNNSFNGELPQQLGRLVRLQYLNLTWNSFEGRIPSNLSQCTDIRAIQIDYNALQGQIPDQLRSLLKLVILSLGSNNLTGNIPPWIGNFSSLYGISLALNNIQGTIPDEFGSLSSLGFFQLYGNNLSGIIPSSIYNISSIYYFSVAQNQLHGQLPPDVGLSLPNLQVFAGGVNNFTGPIPVSLSNASGLQVLDFAQNGLTGTIPGGLGSLSALVRLNFDENSLGNWEIGDLNFLSFLANCTSLEVLGMAENRFGGELPSFIANLSTNLQILTLGGNLLLGSIPNGIGNLVNLSLLGLEGNHFSIVPDVFGKLKQLEGLYLHDNMFSGPIPSSLGNLTRLTRLFMEDNRFEGSIPPSLGDCQNLEELNMSSNNLDGTIPKQVISLSSLSVSLDISNNSLTGSIPFEVGVLNNLVELDLSKNKLSGQIPDSLGTCTSLLRLLLQENVLSGTIPQSLQALRGIEEIDVSRNNLSGEIPEFLSKLLSLRSLDLSYNDFEGEVPREGIFANASAISFAGNNKLCGGVPDLLLPACSTKKLRKVLAPKAVISIAIAATIIILVFCYIAIFNMVKDSRTAESPLVEAQEGMSYLELVKSTDGFSADNLIGSGGFGAVYKGILPGEQKLIAIKVLNLQQQGASKSFFDEYNALRSIRHRNLLKIITSCSSVDNNGNDFKALVFEFMSNGSLEKWLHPGDDELYCTRKLSLMQRLNIAINIASALDYLHHNCGTAIVHCDLKPSNVLLDDDMVAHVGDFGLAKFIFESGNESQNQTLSGGLKGSIGYIPPEYGNGAQVSILGDIYSFGILLLEMFTGKGPTDDMFKDGLSIRKFTSVALAAEHVMDIVDPFMAFEDEEDDYGEKNEDGIEECAMIGGNELQVDKRSKIEECLASVMIIGVSCSTALPSKRMAIRSVVNKLHSIRDSFLIFINQKRRNLR